MGRVRVDSRREPPDRGRKALAGRPRTDEHGLEPRDGTDRQWSGGLRPGNPGGIPVGTSIARWPMVPTFRDLIDRLDDTPQALREVGGGVRKAIEGATVDPEMALIRSR